MAQPKSPSSSAKLRAHERDESHGTRHAHKYGIGFARLMGILLLALVIGAVYGPFVNVPFLFDDFAAIVGNDSIASLWPLVGVGKPGPLNPPSQLPTSARPLVNLSFAINYAAGGVSPTGYHTFNVVIHYLAALALWGVTSRALRLPYFAGRFNGSAEWLGLTAAAVWSLHPLVTETVIYATQRSESMMALFYLATLYCSLQYWAIHTPASTNEAPIDTPYQDDCRNARWQWLLLAGLACLGGMASKEVMVSAPLMVLLFERTFVAGSISAALRRSWPLYAVLAATLILLVVLNANRPHSDAAGFGLGVSAYQWWLTQSKVFFLYLRLVVWPWPLLIHYEFPYVTSMADAWPYVVLLLILGLTTLVSLWCNRPLGYLGTWVFAILSPTFVIPIVTEIAAERRMYLALVAPCVLFVVGGYQLVCGLLPQRRSERNASPASLYPMVSGSLVVALLVVFCLVSTKRLAAYESEMGLWLEVLQSQPNNSMAHHGVAAILEKEGNDEAAMEHYRAAAESGPASSHAHYQLGTLYHKQGDYVEAANHFSEAIRSMPRKHVTATMQNNRAVALYSAGRNDEAIAAFHAALAIDPSDWSAHRNLSTALRKADKYAESIDELKAALRLNPRAIELYNELAKSYRHLDQQPEARAALRQGLKLAQAAGDTENTNRFNAALNAQQ